MKAAYFPLYTSDFLEGTLLFDAEETGAYINLLIYQWSNGFIPNDKKSIKKIAKISEKKLEKVLKKFTLTDGSFYQNERVEAEREKFAKKSEKAKESISKRWHKNTEKTDTNVLPTYYERNTNEYTIKPNHTIPNTKDISTSTHHTTLDEEKKEVVFSKEILEIEKKIWAYFELNEITHFNQIKETGPFVTTLQNTGRLAEFETEFEAYREYKKLSQEREGTLRSFLGTPEKQYSEGRWCSTSWQKQLKDFKAKQNATNKTNFKPAITVGAERGKQFDY